MTLEERIPYSCWAEMGVLAPHQASTHTPPARMGGSASLLLLHSSTDATEGASLPVEANESPTSIGLSDAPQPIEGGTSHYCQVEWIFRLYSPL